MDAVQPLADLAWTTAVPGAQSRLCALRDPVALPKLCLMNSYLLVALGGAAGSVLRFWLSSFLERRLGEAFPWATIIINVAGSFLIGLLFSLSGADRQPLIGPAGRALLLVGVLGGFTTFSAFSLQTLNLLRAGQPGFAGLNIILSVVLCLIAVWGGHLVARSVS